jgi:ketosteroid isomerase-like protein
MAEGYREWLIAWEDFHVEADEYRELDDERVLVLVRISGRGKTSGLDLGPMRTKGAHLFHVKGGKVTRLVIYTDPTRALADLGLAPDAGAP